MEVVIVLDNHHSSWLHSENGAGGGGGKLRQDFRGGGDGLPYVCAIGTAFRGGRGHGGLGPPLDFHI